MQNQHQTPLNNQNLKTSPPQLIKAGGTKNVDSLSYYLELAQSELNVCGWAFCSFFKTPSGKNAMTIKVHANGKFSYIGDYGSGSGHDFETMKKTVLRMMTFHKRTRLVDGFDFLNGEA